RAITVRSNAATLNFQHNYNWKFDDLVIPHELDGSVLEVSTDNGVTFTDLRNSIASGGYNGVINSASNPLHDRPAWIHASGVYSSVTVNLGNFNGQTIRLAFRMGTNDNSVLPTNFGWHIDTLIFTGAACD